MRYVKSLEIEQRLASALELIESGMFSTPNLAEKLGVSIPTISRIVAALRERGHAIKSERQTDGWKYVLDKQEAQVGTGSRMSKRRRNVPR